jgi:Zn-dependent peptidase ImmA (M78 family)
MDPVLARAREARLGTPGDGPLDDVLGLAEEGHGVPVGVLVLEGGLAGAYLRRPRGALILLNGSEPAARLRFTLAHELGHHVLQHGQSVDTRAEISDPRRPMEVDANRFAAELLVPLPAVDTWLAGRSPAVVGLDDVVVLAARFGVSALVALFRLQAAGAVPDRARLGRIREEIESSAHLDLRHRRRLPDLQDGLSAARERMPRVPAGSALDAYARGVMGAERLAALVRASVAEARETMRTADLAPPGG